MAAPTLKSIQVEACDNELIGIAIPLSGTASTELFHFKLGGGVGPAPVNYTVPSIDLLPKGTYQLLFLGINWGGPATFKVIVNTSAPPTTFSFNQPNPGVGLVFNHKIDVSV